MIAEACPKVYIEEQSVTFLPLIIHPTKLQTTPSDLPFTLHHKRV